MSHSTETFNHKKHQAQEIFNHITSEFSHMASGMRIPQFEKPWSYANPALKLRDPVQS